LPYPSEHSCRLNSPDQYDSFARKNCAEKHDGKCVDVIYGIKGGKSEIQALRYDKKIWTESSAKSHCGARKGTFEPASESKAGLSMNRAYSTLEIKSVNDTARKFTGIASTPSTDRVGDIVDPEGARFKLPLSLLWQHDHRDPIGWITQAKVTPKGIEVEGEVAKFDEPGDLQNRLTKAWQMIKARLVRGLSIGFNDLESEPIKGSYGTWYKKWEWLELSAVTIPANAEASITAIKSIDEKLMAALGQTKTPPGVSGNTKVKKG
jgi:HK97 family phage prohead protease